MQCFTPLTPPTAVTHSLSLPFLSPSANNLIIAKTSLLQIFSVKSIITSSTGGLKNQVSQSTRSTDANEPLSPILSPDQSTRGEKLHTTKLVLVAQYELSGTITAIARVKILRSKSGGEALLVALRDAKLSLVEWDPERYSLATISIHLYEREDIHRSPWDPDLEESASYLSVDPRSRCAALKFGSRNIAILPFHQAGDELVMDDYDLAIDGERHDSTVLASKSETENKPREKTPYSASFVLSLLALDPSLSHPLHLAFLHEYREPTFGILSSQFATSTALLHERRDTLSYTVFTLDLEQRASTNLLSVNNLPNDLFAVIALPLPVGGALLVGGNELIHIDQAGKTNAVAVNNFAKHSTAFPMLDQADLRIKLEHCVIEQLGLDSRELLIILHDGELAVLSFKTDGRSVSGLSVRRTDQQYGGSAITTGASCATVIGRGRMFVGSEKADSVILGWSRKSDKPKRPRSRVVSDHEVYEEQLETDEEDLEDDDDLYSGVKSGEQISAEAPSSPYDGSIEDYVFRVHDSMQNHGPMKNVILRKLPGQLRDGQTDREDSSKLELLVSNGYGRAGGLTIFRRKINPDVIEKFNILDANSIWTVCARQISEVSSITAVNGDHVTATEHDKYIIASTIMETGEERSAAYKITSTELEEVKGTDFDPDAGATVEVGTLNSGTRIVQILQGELKTYDGDFGLAQIFPMTDEVTGPEPKVTSASFSDPYVLLIRDDSSAMILRADESGDLEEVEQGEAILNGKWLSGSLYEDSNDVLRLEAGEDSEDEAGNVLMFLLSAEGGLQIFRLPNLKKAAYIADGLSFLPPFLSADFTVRRSAARETLKELLLAELGDSTHKSPYLILRSANNDLSIYQPYQSPLDGSLETSLRFLKIPTSQVPSWSGNTPYDEAQQTRMQPLRAIHDINDYSAVFMPGNQPSFIIKCAASPPQVIPLNTGPIRSLSRLNTSKCERGFIYIDERCYTHAARLPLESQYDTGWVTRRIILGEEVQSFDYHQGKKAYVIGTSYGTDFKLPEEAFHNESVSDETSFLAQSEQGVVKLLDQKTWSFIDKYELDPTEVVMCIKTVTLETSEHTHIRQELVAVGTALVRGEDLPSNGRIYIFAVIDVVPEPDRPETDRKLKLIAKEEVKGAVTTLCEIGSQGFLLVSHGQKCMVRGLKEDGSLLPVAFMDMQCYSTVAKELKGTGLCLMGDLIKGVSLTGYYEEPYQLRFFSKSSQHMEVLAADFLPDGKQLYVAVADSACNIHILQFEPDHPKSLSGQRLLHLTTFHAGHYPSTLTLLPAGWPSRSLLLTSTTGSLSLISPVPPSSHRTLSTLQSHLQSTLPHPLGLNPKAYRAAGTSGARAAIGGVGGEMGGGVLDAGVLRRWGEGGSWRRWDGGMGVGGAEGEGVGVGFGAGVAGAGGF